MKTLKELEEAADQRCRDAGIDPTHEDVKEWLWRVTLVHAIKTPLIVIYERWIDVAPLNPGQALW